MQVRLSAVLARITSQCSAQWSDEMKLLKSMRTHTSSFVHRHLLRSLERAWLAPYFRAACLRQGARGMQLGAELMEGLDLQHPQPSVPSNAASSVPHTPSSFNSAAGQSSSATPHTSTVSEAPSPSQPTPFDTVLEAPLSLIEEPHPSTSLNTASHPSLRYAMGHNVAAEELSRSLAIPPAELVQTAQVRSVIL